MYALALCGRADGAVRDAPVLLFVFIFALGGGGLFFVACGRRTFSALLFHEPAVSLFRRGKAVTVHKDPQLVGSGAKRLLFFVKRLCFDQACP